MDRKALVEGKRSLISIIFSNFFTKNRIIFALVSVFTFLALTLVFYQIYGYEFIYEAYLYHFIRKDNRHNFSVHFYMIYQMYDLDSTKLMAVLTFLP